MRRLVTGVDAQGRSCIVEAREFSAPDDESRSQHASALFETTTNPPQVDARRSGAFVDLDVPAGVVRWLVVRYEPGATTQMHHTDSIDLDTVVQGTVQLVLDDGDHELGPGDCVVVTGVGHAWHVGSEELVMIVCNIGTRAPS
jgi:quercetin dioxygenase-like cupin family protein